MDGVSAAWQKGMAIKTVSRYRNKSRGTAVNINPQATGFVSGEQNSVVHL